MAKLRIFSVGFELPGPEFENIPFSSDRTLLDADVVLFKPTLGKFKSDRKHNALPILTEDASVSIQRHLEHWHSEIREAVKVGRLVIIYLAKPIECYRLASRIERKQRPNNAFVKVSSYQAIPSFEKVLPKSGTTIQVEPGAFEIASYWADFSAYSPYEVEIEGTALRPLLKSRSGNRVVGAAINLSEGILLCLPPLSLNAFVINRPGEQTWTDDVHQFGIRLAKALVATSKNLKQDKQRTPEPEWARKLQYRSDRENALQVSIEQCATVIFRVQARKAALESQLSRAGSLRRLLYEQGRQLEEAVLEAMRLFGFQAQNYADGESEFDVVLVSPEGRCIGEAEGKDKRAINIEKFGQLERNIHEDFARDQVSEQAKGVLFGNAFRLLPPEERAEFFTVKCLTAARRVGAALVRTPDLLAPATYLRENSSDTAYAKQCRQAIFRSKGDIVTFSTPPWPHPYDRASSE